MGIKIKGVIGWDVVGTSFADMFSRLSGDVDIEIDSPGGSVFDGVSIYNAIKNYKKGKCKIRVTQACSMAAYIMLAGDSLVFEPNACVMVHNPFNGIIGDYRAMEKNASLLKRLSALYAAPFVEKGIFEEKEIRSLMDEETYFIGAEELAKLGEVADGGDNVEKLDKDITVASVQETIKSYQARMRQEETQFDYERIAACLPPIQNKTETSAKSVSSEIDKVVVQEKGEKIMDLQELKTKNPDVYAAAVKVGVEQERSRVSALMPFIEIAKETTISAISEGKTIHDDAIASAFLLAKINNSSVKAMEGENPPAVNPAEPAHAPENEEPSEEEKAKQAAEAEAKSFSKILSYMGIESK